MREILFRGKRTDCGEWVEGDLVQAFRGNQLSSCGIMPKTPTAYCWRVDSETVGQYTGLTDKNGKRIFEGDIVSLTKWKGLIYKVVYDNCRYELYNANETCCYAFSIYKSKDIEVIGNIHDNPELLGGENNGNN